MLASLLSFMRPFKLFTLLNSEPCLLLLDASGRR